MLVESEFVYAVHFCWHGNPPIYVNSFDSQANYEIFLAKGKKETNLFWKLI